MTAPLTLETQDPDGTRRKVTAALIRHDTRALLRVSEWANGRWYGREIQLDRAQWAGLLNDGQDLLAVMPVEAGR